MSIHVAHAQESGLYEPLIDEDARGFKPAKYQKDLAFCRKRAAPLAEKAAAHAQAANEGAQQAAAGAALSTAGNIVAALPIPGFTAARNVWAGGTAADAVGGAVSAGGAAKQAEAGAAAGAAAGDYQLVVDSCLIKRGYRFLR
ncbi:MAG TPA: hypothetical protein PKA55_11095 [Rhodoblastus sp.]|nr:hypothetical protein [Rhodoblastus sp.]